MNLNSKNFLANFILISISSTSRQNLEFIFFWNFRDTNAAIVAQRSKYPCVDITPFDAVNRIFMLIVSM